jgi:ADP-heptose:LPS heptosyltransferase
MHIGAALKKPIVSIWGNTIPDFGMYPFYGKSKVQNQALFVSDLSCRPCSKIGYSMMPERAF